ncbi:MAG TPA: TonB-dependent receptor [Ignavibacteriaceae bacterium]|nr:TonB-dependent receptor [Ignavibacteriaceae bacterium]
MFRHIILFFFIVIINISALAQGELSGYIKDNEGPLQYCNVIIQDTKFGNTSDKNGFYSFKNLPDGKYRIKFSLLGYETQFHNIEILNNKINLNVVLKSSVIQLEPIEVKDSRIQEVNDTRTSLIEVDPKDAKILPGAGEDVLRTLQSLPGVVAPNDFSSQLVVRGSGPDQNLIIMDDVEIFNPYRLYGVISMFNPESVSEINLVTGGFPSRYGDRLSAVLDVVNREGSRKSYFSGSVNASIIDANIIFEGKMPLGIEGSWLVSSRRTYYDLIIEPFVKNAGLVEENVNFPHFYDVQSKIVIGPYDGNKFTLNGIYSRDGVDVISSKERKTPDSISVYNITRNDVASFSWDYAPTSKIYNKIILSWYENSGAATLSSKILDPSLQRDKFKNTLADTLAPYLYNLAFDANFSYVKYSADDRFTYQWNKNIFEAGAGMDYMKNIIDFKFNIAPELLSIIASNPQFRAVFDNLRDIKYVNKYRAFMQNNFAISDRLFLQPGVRFDYYDLLSKYYIAPRFAFSYALNDITTLRGVWGIYYQSPGYEKFFDQNVMYNFNKEKVVNLEAEKAIHYVLSIERWLSSEWNVKLEGYYKDFRDLIIPQKFTGNFYSVDPIPGQDQRYTSGWTNPVSFKRDSLTQNPINNSYGESYGVEVLISKKNILPDNVLSGWVSFAHAYANRFDNGKKQPFRFDQRNTFNIVLNYQINSWLDFGMRWQYGSGFPYVEPNGIKPRIILTDQNNDGKPETPIIVTREIGTPAYNKREVVFDVDFGTGEINAYKPAYHRMDIRFTFSAKIFKKNWKFYLDIINVYNRANVIGYDYYITEDLKLGREASTMFPIIPTIGLSVKF